MIQLNVFPARDGVMPSERAGAGALQPVTQRTKMPKVIIIEHDGAIHELVSEDGESVMEAALKGGVESIVAECGGACGCATCHVYVDEAWVERLPAKQIEEEEQLDLAADVRPESRLSCQIFMTNELDGLVVRTPANQGR
jgi:ferredoxin, 2Fe-2S